MTEKSLIANVRENVIIAKEKHMEKTKKLMPLNIQLFAENGDGGQGGDPSTPKTYTQEEVDKINAELEKIRKANNDLSKENAEHKRKAKEKLSEEEKIAQAQKEKDEALATAQKELLQIKLSKEYLVAGFDEETVNQLVKSFTEEDGVQFAKTITNCIKKLVENVRKEEQIKFQQSGTVPPTGSGKQKSGLDPVVEKYINTKNTNINAAYEKIF